MRLKLRKRESYSSSVYWRCSSISVALLALAGQQVAPCNGSASIDIKSGSPSSWPNLPSFNSSEDHNLASVTIPAKFTEQACLVTAGDAGATFDISVQTTLYDRPLPGNGGLLAAEMISSGTARVLINTTENEVTFSSYGSRRFE